MLLLTAAAIAAAPVRSVKSAEPDVAAKLPLLITAECEEKVVKCGEEVSFTVVPVVPPEASAKIRIFQWRDGLKIAQCDHPVKNFTVKMRAASPGHLMVTGIYIDRDGRAISPPPRTSGYGDGVLVAPEKLRRSRKRPADFDRFWAGELRKLSVIPMRAERKVYKNGDSWRCDEVKISSIADIPVTGFLVMPKKAAKKSLPAVIYFHGAGFKSSTVRTGFKDRAIVFDVNAHGIKNGMPREFYRKLNRKPPVTRNIFSGRNEREKSYFKNMFLRTVRAIEFVKSLPEWDGRNIIVAGRSQGGAQAIAAAALSRDVTLCIANVPALADHGGIAVKRAPGWPGINAADFQASAAASDYIDIVNLASRITCETHMSIGLIDPICPPVSVWLTYMEIRGMKSMTLFPQMGHNAPPAKFDGRIRIEKEINK